MLGMERFVLEARRFANHALAKPVAWATEGMSQDLRGVFALNVWQGRRNDSPGWVLVAVAVIVDPASLLLACYYQDIKCQQGSSREKYIDKSEEDSPARRVAATIGGHRKM